MSSLLLLVPVAAVAYFVWQSTKSRIFLLGIPFLQFFRESVFFESLRPFWIPGRFSTVVITMLWLVAVWAVCTDQLLPRGRAGEKRLPPFGPKPLPEELAFVGLGIVVVVGVVTTALRHADPLSAVGQASGVLFMLMGYLLVRGIVCHSERVEVMRFVQAIVVLNTVAATLFIVHQGLHIRIYGAAEYFETVFQGKVITRTFTFMSPLLIFALAVSFAKRHWTVSTYVIIAVNLIAVWVSYTRTMLAMAAIVAAISIIARLFKRGQGTLAVRRALAVTAAAVSVAVIVVTILPTESNFFVSRIQGAMEGGGITSAGNLEVRNARLARTFALVADDELLLGRGFVSASQDPLFQTMRVWSWDSAWIAIVYRMGLAGVIAFAALLVAYSVRALWLFLRQDQWAEEYGLMWFSYIVATAISSFIGWGFMDQTRYPMNLWFLAFVAAGVVLPQVAEERLPHVGAARSVAGASRSPALLGSQSPPSVAGTTRAVRNPQQGGPQIG